MRRTGAGERVAKIVAVGLLPAAGRADAQSVDTRRPYDIDSLTDVALRVFAERGYDGASMDDVARAAGITKASIYHHVSSKEALLERGLTRAIDALNAILDEAPARDGEADARLRYILRRVAETTLALLPELTVLFRARGSSKSERRPLDERRRFDRHITELIAQAQRDGTVRTDLDARLVVRLMFGMSNSVVEWFRTDASLSVASVTGAIEAIVFDGVRAR